MTGRIPRWYLLVGIVTVAIGCDNVSWGGMSVRLDSPSRDSLGVMAEGDSGVAEPAPLQVGPILYAGIRNGDSATVVPVAELMENGLGPLPGGEEGTRLATQLRNGRFRTGTRFTLFHAGTRIGTFTVASSRLDPGHCHPRPEALGHVELLPSAGGVQRFLALEEDSVPGGAGRTTWEPEVGRAQRDAAQNLAGEALNQLQAPWPPALQNIREDLQAIHLDESPEASVVATFAYRDRMEVTPAQPDAYSLLVLGEPTPSGLVRTFTWYRPVAEEGKGVPRFFSWADWDGDGRDEVVLEVFGAEARWWAALDRIQGEWSLIFQDSCGSPVSPGSPRP